MAQAVFADLPPILLRDVSSAVGHYVAGVLSQDAMVGFVEGACRRVTLQPGDRVRSRRGSIRGILLQIDAGVAIVKVDGSGAVIRSNPDSLIPDRSD